MIRAVTNEDARAICDIYNYYVQNTIHTFEEEPVPLIEMGRRITEVTDSLPWFIFEEDNRIVGYTYASKWKGRCAYRFSVESTVYIKYDALGKGIGTLLYTRLLEELKHHGLHSVIGGIALPNETSQKLHEKLGFKKVAHFTEIGFKFNTWIDVGYWELHLNEFV
jgi:L-amino acid N-acyltransferase YncA